MKINLTSEAAFNEPLTAGALQVALASFPPEAHIAVETWDSQRDGSGWRIKARWTEDR